MYLKDYKLSLMITSRVHRHFYLDVIDREIIEANHLSEYNASRYNAEFITFDNKLIYYVDSVISSSFCVLLRKRERILSI